MTAEIIGTGSALPMLAVNNRELEGIVDTTDEWIKSRTGIENRHIAVEETTTSLAVKAAEAAIRNAGVSAQELDLIIVGTVSGDLCFPSTACQIQKALSAPNAVAFDMNAACAGFLFGLAVAEAYFKASMAKTALIVGAEVLSKMMDWKDRSTCVLFGDGAGAAVVKASDAGVLSMVQGSDGERGCALTCGNRPVNNPFVSNPFRLEYAKMEGQAVYRFAVRTVPEAARQAIRQAGIEMSEIKYFLLHQANIRIIEAVAKKLEQPMEKFPTNLQKYGNISAASVPILLDDINQSGRLQKGDKILLAGFGAGLTWGAAVLEWQR